MKTRYFLVTLVLGLGLGLASALLWALGGQTLSAVAASNAEGANVPDALAAELHVCLSGCPYSSVQAAVDVAGHGDIIKVAAGTYTDVHVRPRNDITTTGVVTQMVYLTKTVSIEGGYTIDNWTTPDPVNNPTILDAGGQGRVIYIVKNNIQPTIRGLELTGGDAAGLQGEPLGDGHVGGGIYIMAASPIIENCQIRDNTAGAGGGLYFTAWDMWEAHKYLSKRNQVL